MKEKERPDRVIKAIASKFEEQKQSTPYPRGAKY
jgi:hypothetical protein